MRHSSSAGASFAGASFAGASFAGASFACVSLACVLGPCLVLGPARAQAVGAQELDEKAAAFAEDVLKTRLEVIAWLVSNEARVKPRLAARLHGEHREYQLQIERLLAQLTDERWLAREEAERTLGEVGGKARALIDERRRTAPLLEERMRCEKILRALDTRGTAKEVSDARILAGLAISTLSMQPDPNVRDALVSALGHPDPLVIDAVVRALGVHGEGADAEIVASYIRSAGAEGTPRARRSSALGSLTRIRGPRALELMRDLLRGDTLNNAEAVLVVRALHERRDAAKLLAELGSHPDPLVAAAARLELPDAGAAAPPDAAPAKVSLLLGDRTTIDGDFLGFAGDAVVAGNLVPGLPRAEIPLEQCAALVFPAKAAAPTGCRVFLTQGTLLTGKLLALDAEHVQLDSPVFGKLKIPRAKIQGLALDPKLDRLLGGSAKNDRFRDPEGKFQDGKILELAGDVLRFAGTDGAPQDVPLAQVSGLLFQRPLVASGDQGVYSKVELQSGDRLLAQLGACDPRRLAVVVPALGAAVIPIEQLVRIEFGIGGGALWGFTLIADYSDNKVIEVDEQGRETFLMEDVYGVWDARCLDNGNLLITEFSNSRVFEATRSGQIVWEYAEGLRSPNAAERLANGNTLIANTFRQEVIEVSKEKKVVWRYAEDVRPFDAERLANGNTLIADMLHDRVIEVDPAGKIVWFVDKMPSAYDADRLPNGNTLITLRTLNKVVEVDREGREVWRLEKLSTPSDADRLPNGNTLVAENGAVREFDRNGNVVWKKEMTWAVEVNRY